MKRTCLPYYILAFILVSFGSGLKAQNHVFDEAAERIAVFTDRTMYVSGEKVFFSAVIYNIQNTPMNEVSRVFYCELITHDGTRIASGKYLLENAAGQGCLTIPEELISGIYYLKFYTRFMRNTSTDEYKYIMLKIINPFKTEVLSGTEAIDTAFRAMNGGDGVTGGMRIRFLSEKKIFAPREEVRINITGDTGKAAPERYSLSVVPEYSCRYSDVLLKSALNADKNSVYFPETRGISLTGQVIDKESGKALPNVIVNLSIIDNKDIQVVRTDSSGRFYFALPDFTGKKDIFLCAEDLPDITPVILIDNDLCSRQTNLPSPQFMLNAEEAKAAFKLAVNARVTSRFSENTVLVDSTENDTVSPFYGTPSDVFVMAKYIDLPTLEEYFSELPVQVRLRKVKGKKKFIFYTAEADMAMHDPLVLVDWVAVDNMDKILAMSPLEIKRIELVGFPYLKGEITYGGIVSFVSKKNNFAGIDLPTSGTFVNYEFLEECIPESLPPTQSVNIPDSRNTVYWNPAVFPNHEGVAGISFTTPDTPGRYLILLRGIRKTGEEVVIREIMEVSGTK